MRNIAMQVAYDGTDFCGWQIQNSQRTVQLEVESVLERLHGKKITVASAGRTDSGVHASCQVVNFQTTQESMPAEKFSAAMNSLLPQDVRIVRSFEVHRDFHATRDAIQRRYRYYFYHSAFADPLLDRFRLRLSTVPNLSVLNAMASLLIGTHDFSSLASKKEGKTMVRTIHQAVFFPDQYGMVFEIAGRGFLWKMVRTIVGTMLSISGEADPRQNFCNILAACDRQYGGKTAAPHGLVLCGVQYPDFCLPNYQCVPGGDE